MIKFGGILLPYFLYLSSTDVVFRCSNAGGVSQYIPNICIAHQITQHSYFEVSYILLQACASP